MQFFAFKVDSTTGVKVLFYTLLTRSDWLASSEYRSDWLALVQSIFACQPIRMRENFTLAS